MTLCVCTVCVCMCVCLDIDYAHTSASCTELVFNRWQLCFCSKKSTNKSWIYTDGKSLIFMQHILAISGRKALPFTVQSKMMSYRHNSHSELASVLLASKTK